MAMLADKPEEVGAGSLAEGAQAADASKQGLVNFIAQELPIWRDRENRPTETGETRLTDQLCSHLNSAVRKSEWDHIQFRTEVPDEDAGNRTVDMAPKPSGCEVIIAGVKYTDMDMLFPIECKRLPTPDQDKGRDEREYVIVA